MKLREIINETPYLNPDEMGRESIDGTISVSALDREYRKLGEVDDVEIRLDQYATHCIGLDVDRKPNAEGRVRQVFRIRFKPKHELNFNHQLRNPIQIDKVAINRSFGNQGIMSRVYKKLADHGFSIVSDSTQFEPAQSLWMKIANDPSYTVRIADVDNGFFKDADGCDEIYRGADLIKADAWTTGSDFTGYNRVIVLTKR